MKKILTVLLTSVLIGCGSYEEPAVSTNTKKQGDKKQKEQSDPYLEQYMKHFHGLCLHTTAANRCKENLQKVRSINFVDAFDEKTDPNGSVAGVCWWSRFSRKIEIKRGIAEPGSVREKALIFHELGHCLLDLGHSDPNTKMLMNPYLFDEKTYASNWTRLQNELFQLILSLLLADQEDLSDDKEVPIF